MAEEGDVVPMPAAASKVVQVAGHGRISSAADYPCGSRLVKPVRPDALVIDALMRHPKGSLRFLEPFVPRVWSALASDGKSDAFELISRAWDSSATEMSVLERFVIAREVVNVAPGQNGFAVVMENLCTGMRHPRLVDVKIGRLRTTPAAGTRGAEKELKDDGTTAKSLGARLTGISLPVRDPKDDGRWEDIAAQLPDEWDREQIRSREALSAVLRHFVGEAENWPPAGVTVGDFLLTAGAPVFKSVVVAIVAGLHALVATLDAHAALLTDDISFLSASVLIAYDAAAEHTGDGRVIVKLIDFDRSGPRSEHFSEQEIGFLPGMHALLAIFEEMLSDM